MNLLILEPIKLYLRSLAVIIAVPAPWLPAYSASEVQPIPGKKYALDDMILCRNGTFSRFFDFSIKA